MTSARKTPLAILGRYTLWEKLAQGGMAELFLATLEGAEGFQKPAVVKRMLPELAVQASYREMFAQEARLMATFSHRHILGVLDFGEAQGTYYLALEHVDGLDLAALLQRGIAVPTPVAVYLAASVLRGLDYVHRQRDASGEPLHIVHRDVTPQNVLLGKNGDVKVGDFGIAKTLRAPSRTAPGSTRGKLGYMSPEQARGQPLDGRADLFSVAVVLYQVLLGRSPFAAETEPALLAAVQKGSLVGPEALALAVGEPLAKVIHAALSVDREARPASGELLARALEKACAETAGPEDIARLVTQALAEQPADEAPARTPHSAFSAVLDLK